MHRSIAPLKQAEDAVYLDSSAMTIEEVAEKIQTLMREKGGSKDCKDGRVCSGKRAVATVYEEIKNGKDKQEIIYTYARLSIMNRSCLTWRTKESGLSMEKRT